MAALALSAATSAFGAVQVPVSSNLTQVIKDNATTEQLHEFELLGNVTMETAYPLNTLQRYNVSIDGQGHTITKRSNDYAFAITNNMENASLAIRNAHLTSHNISNSRGMIRVDTANATIDLDGTRIHNSNATQNGFSGGLTTWAENTVVKGNVIFEANYSTSGNAGAVAAGDGINNTSLIFEGKTNFINNYGSGYGGAIIAATRSTITFKDDATFTGNHANTSFGGAIQARTGADGVTFEKNATFTNNYVKNSRTDSQGVRGGAINFDGMANNDSPQLKMYGTSKFTGNYAWGNSTTPGLGGAISLSAPGSNPMHITNINTNYSYGATFEQGIFTGNYAYSNTGDGYGGAIFAKSYGSTLTFGSGSSFTGNAAKTLGGAIYFDQGTINLNGNVTFSGNRHGASFNTTSGRPVLNAGSGSANAIYFAVSSNTATLKLNSGAGEVIHFADPIQSAAGKTVSVNKTGSGTALFTGHNSDILAKTFVSQGTFELGDGVAYGRTGTVATSSFHLSNGATLKGGNNATLRASSIQLDGRLEVENGIFNFDGSDVTLSSTSVVALTIDDMATYASINMNNSALDINNAALEITATNYVPSQEISDTFTLVSNLSEQASGTFLQGDSITINGAEFTIHYNANSITLQQMTVPEPSTYALILAAGALATLCIRRHKRKGAVSIRQK